MNNINARNIHNVARLLRMKQVKLIKDVIIIFCLMKTKYMRSRWDYAFLEDELFQKETSRIFESWFYDILSQDVYCTYWCLNIMYVWVQFMHEGCIKQILNSK